MHDPSDTSKAGFTVDTHLFVELGELLVRKDSTALVELVKNSYDADATKVKAEFKNGLLTVHLPKSEHAKPKQIEVNVA